MFTYQYKQPDEYHFSLDSIHLAEFVFEHLKSHPDLETWRVLDLCAGCGVIGLELSWYLRELKQFDFVEIQDIYTSHFHQNVLTVNRPELTLNWHLLNYEELLGAHWKEKFNLIVSNPPYFQPGQGMLSPSHFKNRCRFYLDSSFTNFIRVLVNTLSDHGKAYFLLRPLHQHGYDAFSDIQNILRETTVSAKKISVIRGTDVILLEKFIERKTE